MAKMYHHCSRALEGTQKVCMLDVECCQSTAWTTHPASSSPIPQPCSHAPSPPRYEPNTELELVRTKN